MGHTEWYVYHFVGLRRTFDFNEHHAVVHEDDESATGALVASTWARSRRVTLVCVFRVDHVTVVDAQRGAV